MLTKTKILFALILLVFCCSCKTSKIPQADRKITYETVNILNGTFENRNNETAIDRWKSLWSVVTPFYRDSIKNWSQAKINLQVEGNHVHFSLLLDSVTFKKEVFRYKIKNGYLVFKNNRVQGIPFVFYRFQHRKIYLTLNDEGRLLTHIRGESGGGLLIITAGEIENDDLIFGKAKTL